MGPIDFHSMGELNNYYGSHWVINYLVLTSFVFSRRKKLIQV